MVNPRSFHDGAFTPRQFPLDPFNQVVQPWSIDLDVLPDDDSLALQQKVVLVLGEPPLSALAPLLQSPHLSSSLLILATARTYLFPTAFIPSVTLFHLSCPISSDEQPAHRLVHIFQCADRLAASWRTHPSPPQFQEFNLDGSLSPPSAPSRPMSWFSGGGSTSSSPSSSQIGLQTPPRSLSRLSVTTPNPTGRTSSFLGNSSTSLSGLSTITMTAVPTPRPTPSPGSPLSFDALLNFLPPDGPTDRALLKLAILITTVSRPFLTASPDAGISRLGSAPNRQQTPRVSKKVSSLRLGFRTKTRSSLYVTPASPVPTPTQLLHLIPPSRSSLCRPLESFCLSFAYPQTHSHHRLATHRASIYSVPKSHLDNPANDNTIAPRPYLLPPYSLSELLPLSSSGRTLEWSLLEVILSGALDAGLAPGEGSEDENEGAGPGEFGMRAIMSGAGRRACLTGVAEVVVRGSGLAIPKPAAAKSMTDRAFEKSAVRRGAGAGWSALAGNGQMRYQYPTPPSSEGSSPSVSPAPEVDERYRRHEEGCTKVPLAPSSSGHTPGLLSYSTSGSSSTHSGGGPPTIGKKKRRGLLRWMRRSGSSVVVG